MKIDDVRARAFAMPLNDPAYPKPPYKFYNREFVVITYRTDPDALREVVPEPLEVVGDTVAYEFIRMPDSTGFGDYTETGQVIPVRFTTPTGEAQEGGYVHAMYLDDNSPIAGGREIWGFPKKMGRVALETRDGIMRGTVERGGIQLVEAAVQLKTFGSADDLARLARRLTGRALGLVLSGLRRQAESREHLEAALRIREKLLPPNDELIASALHNLGQHYAMTGDFDKSVPLYERAIAIKAGLFGEKHPKTFNSVEGLGMTLWRANRLSQAEPILARLHAGQLEQALHVLGGRARFRPRSQPVASHRRRRSTLGRLGAAMAGNPGLGEGAVARRSSAGSHPAGQIPDPHLGGVRALAQSHRRMGKH